MGLTNHDELESKLTFLEKTVDDLSDVVLAQGRTLEALERTLARLESRLAVVSDSAEEPRDLEADRPPHY